MSQDETILLVEDDADMRDSCRQALEQVGYRIVEAASGNEAQEILLREEIDLIITDLRMPHGTGQELVEAAKEVFSDLPIIMITAYPSVESAVQSFKSGIVDYLAKPFTGDQLLEAAKSALEVKRVHDRARLLSSIGPSDSKIPEIVGSSQRMESFLKDIRRIASLEGNVLAFGATGSGKELAAKAIHKFSSRAAIPLMAINCAAIPEALLEFEIFGHEKDSFTGTETSKAGLLEKAHNGILCLDNVCELPLAVQAKLLQSLEEKACQRVGGVASHPVDVRVVALTKKNLREEITAGRFREDLFYCLSSLEIRVPSLREHPEDIPQLAVHFFNSLSTDRQKEVIVGFSEEALDLLAEHPWPGNIREFQNAIQKILSCTSGPLIGAEDILQSDAISPFARSQEAPSLRRAVLLEFERDYLARVIKQHNGNITHASKTLGIHRTTLQRLIKKYGVKSQA